MEHTGTAADNFVRSRIYLLPVSGATPSGVWHWQASVDTGTPSFSDAMTLTSAGLLTLGAISLNAANSKIQTNGSVQIGSVGFLFSAVTRRSLARQMANLSLGIRPALVLASPPPTPATYPPATTQPVFR